jgi:prepilin-type N-terminal cleavage/methylation domain-containing protein
MISTVQSDRKQRGMTLIELLAAFSVLLVGMTGGLLLLMTAITANASNRLETSAGSVAEMTLEQLQARPSGGATGGTTVTISDCRPQSAGGPQTWTLEAAGDASGKGARVLSANGMIDFLQPYSDIPANYKMRFQACTVQGRPSIVEVRFNVRVLTKNTRLITVGARAQANGRLFQQPVMIRTIVGY